MRVDRVVAVGGPRISRVILFCLALLPSAGHAQPPSSATRNLETLNLALVETVSMFEQPFGLTPSTLTDSGGFTEVGWNALLGGSYGGMPVAPPGELDRRRHGRRDRVERDGDVDVRGPRREPGRDRQ